MTADQPLSVREQVARQITLAAGVRRPWHELPDFAALAWLAVADGVIAIVRQGDAGTSGEREELLGHE